MRIEFNLEDLQKIIKNAAQNFLWSGDCSHPFDFSNTTIAEEDVQFTVIDAATGRPAKGDFEVVFSVDVEKKEQEA